MTMIYLYTYIYIYIYFVDKNMLYLQPGVLQVQIYLRGNINANNKTGHSNEKK